MANSENLIASNGHQNVIGGGKDGFLVKFAADGTRLWGTYYGGTEDMLGMFERVPRFVKRYEAIAETISGAAQRYAEEVRARTFPTVDQTYQPK